ncbi:MAG: hypothetical protein Q9224_000648 [Gallowayella concinna]
MESARLPPVATLPDLSTEERAAVLDQLFEPCIPLHTISVNLLRETSFKSYTDLVGSIGLQLTALAQSSSASDSEWLQDILAAHPRLGQTKVESTLSRAEQAQLNVGGESSAQSLTELNLLYEQTFPGLRYVVYVNGRSRAAIISDMKARIERRDPMAERHSAIKVGLRLVAWEVTTDLLRFKAMCDIAIDRVRKASGGDGSG